MKEQSYTCENCGDTSVSFVFSEDVKALERDLARLTEDKEALRKDAERYQTLRTKRPVLLITGFFGNFCVNKTVDDVDAAIDAANADKG